MNGTTKCAICGKEIRLDSEHCYIDVTPNNHDDYRLYVHLECVEEFVDDVLMEKFGEIDWGDDE